MKFAMQRGSRVSGCEVKPVGTASWLVEARGGLEAVEQMVRCQPVALDRLRVAIGNLDGEPPADGKAGRFDGGEWTCPLGLLAGAL
jgi:hypothetical protein